MHHTWIEYHNKLKIADPTALVGSPGLRSIGRLVIDHLVAELAPQLVAELYSIHFPLIYQTSPSYASHPRLPGIGGVNITQGEVSFPQVKFYAHPSPPLIITNGYHANFDGQYEVGEQVLDLYAELNVKRIIVVAGYGLEGKKVCCAATNQKILDEMKAKYDIDVGYTGPFYGFSGIIFGLAKVRGIEALSLFARTQPDPENPESPDTIAAKTLLNKLVNILDLSLDIEFDIIEQ